MIEFMLSVTFLTVLVLSIFELFGLLYTYNVIADAAKEGVRYAIVHGVSNSSPSGPATQQTASTPPCTTSSPNVSNVQTQVQNFAGLSLHDTSNMTVNVCYLNGNNKLNSQVQVTIIYPFRAFFHLSWPSVTINANAAGRIVF
jgi:Flp pilus assembly protein TadG